MAHTELEPSALIADVPPPLGEAKPRLVVIFPALMLAVGISALDQQIVSTALPRIVAELGGLAHLSWVVTAFLITQTITLPLYGKLSDLYGRKRLFMISISIFLIGSALCGMAQTMMQLIVFRAVQGLGAGGIFTLVSATVADFVAPRERGRYQGYFSGVFVACTVAGPVVGGLLTSAFTWRSVFLVNLPLGAIVMVVLGLTLPKTKRVSHQIDYLGVVLIALSAVPMLLGLSWAGVNYPWTSPVIIGLLLTAAAVFAVLIAHERRAAEPVLGVHLASNKVVRWTILTSGLVGFAFYGSNIFLPLYFQVVLGQPPAIAGLMILPQVLGNLVSSLVGGHLISRQGRYKAMLVGGVCALTLCFAILGYMCSHPAPFWIFAICLFAMGMAGNLCVLSMTIAVQNAVERKDLGVATSSMGFLNSLLGSAGVALFGAVLASNLQAYFNSHGSSGLSAKAVSEMLHHAATMTPVVTGAYREAIANAFYVSAVLNLLTVFAAIKVPQIAMRDKVKD